MDSKSLDKALNPILNTLPRTVAPLGAITNSVKKNQAKIWQKKNLKFFFSWNRNFHSRLSLFHDFFPMSFILSANLLKRIKKTESERKYWELTVWNTS